MERYLTPDQAKLVIEAASPSWVKLALRIQWATGARASEVVGCKARPKDGQKEHPGIHGKDVLPHQRIRVYGKNTRGKQLRERVVLCVDAALHRELMEMARTNPGKLLPYSYWGYDDAIRRIRKHLPPELQWFHSHAMRHSHAIAAIRGQPGQGGVDLVSLQRQLGHRDLTETAGYLRLADLNDAAYLRAFGGASKPDGIPVECLGCGFSGAVNEQGQWTTESRMGVAMRRRR